MQITLTLKDEPHSGVLYTTTSTDTWKKLSASANHFVLDSSGQCHTEPQSPQLSPYWTALSR